MSRIDKINTSNSNINKFRQQMLNNNIENATENENSKRIDDKAAVGRNIILDQITYKKPNKKEKYQNISAIKRPLRIDKSNNIFYINYKNENKAIEIEPGEYNFIELRQAIQDKVKESFGIGKVKLDLTASGSDRLIWAEESNSGRKDNYADISQR